MEDPGFQYKKDSAVLKGLLETNAYVRVALKSHVSDQITPALGDITSGSD